MSRQINCCFLKTRIMSAFSIIWAPHVVCRTIFKPNGITLLKSLKGWMKIKKMLVVLDWCGWKGEGGNMSTGSRCVVGGKYTLLPATVVEGTKLGTSPSPYGAVSASADRPVKGVALPALAGDAGEGETATGLGVMGGVPRLRLAAEAGGGAAVS
ncbi:unnamed protein product [Meganyctiphanes norvegica]|uniref:Uncharacterized protein n=1 Tax=Meganyctiphanes norvegica TaxID=48144 RepID=A0AAV2QQ45_MEGNR